MKTTTKKLIMLHYNYFKEIEEKLEHYAKKGLILEKIGGTLWTFKKSEPQDIKYTVTYFNEGSIFNPHPTDNQLTYFEYAKAGGWDYVCEYNQMQIFSSPLENPPPFETDANEQLLNIHKCMKKSFIPAQIVMLVLWLMNTFIRVDDLLKRPSNFLSNNLDLITLLMFLSVSIFTAYSLMNYYSWYAKSKKSIARGGNLINAYSKIKKYIEIFYIICLLLMLGYTFLAVFPNTSFEIIVLAVLPIPLFGLAFNGSIKLLKKFHVSAKTNKIASYGILCFTFIFYLSVVFSSVMNFGFMERTDKPYTTVNWEIADGETRQYRLYQDELPLTCEDLYGEINFNNYSYEEQIDDSVFLKKVEYSQNAAPMQNPPPEIHYTIYTPKFEFVQSMIFDELTFIDEWRNQKAEVLDNSIFGTQKAYTYYFLEEGKRHYNGEYLLVFEDHIIRMFLGEPLTDEGIDVVKAKLY